MKPAPRPIEPDPSPDVLRPSLRALLSHLGMAPDTLRARLAECTGHVTQDERALVEAVWLVRWESEQVRLVAQAWLREGPLAECPEALFKTVHLQEMVRRGLFPFKGIESVATFLESSSYDDEDLRQGDRRKGPKAQLARRFQREMAEYRNLVREALSLAGTELTEAQQAELEARAVAHPPAGLTSGQTSQALRDLAERLHVNPLAQMHLQHSAARRFEWVPVPEGAGGLPVWLASYVRFWRSQAADQQKRTAMEFLLHAVHLGRTGHVFQAPDGSTALSHFCAADFFAHRDEVWRWRCEYLGADADDPIGNDRRWDQLSDDLELLVMDGSLDPNVHRWIQLAHWLVCVDECSANAAEQRSSKWWKKWWDFFMGRHDGDEEQA